MLPAPSPSTSMISKPNRSFGRNVRSTPDELPTDCATHITYLPRPDLSTCRPSPLMSWKPAARRRNSRTSHSVIARFMPREAGRTHFRANLPAGRRNLAHLDHFEVRALQPFERPQLII